jgi:DNA-directed RNA polymerase alpha subunit
MGATAVSAKEIGFGIAERIFSDKEYVNALAEKIKESIVEKGVVDAALFDFAQEGLEHIESAEQYVREANKTIITGNQKLDSWGKRVAAAEIANRKRDKDILELKGMVRDLSKTVDILLAVIGGGSRVVDIKTRGQAEAPADQGRPPFLYEEIHMLPLSVRTLNLMSQAGMQTVADLIEYSETDLRKIPKLGRKTANEILTFLEEHGLRLKE